MGETTGFYSCIDLIGIMTNAPIYNCKLLYDFEYSSLYSKNFLWVKGFIRFLVYYIIQIFASSYSSEY